jgi:hypothetical protein
VIELGERGPIVGERMFHITLGDRRDLLAFVGWKLAFERVCKGRAQPRIGGDG